ncbi:MAG: methyltransferase domain-containing protein [Pseudomonadota bacterium]
MTSPGYLMDNKDETLRLDLKTDLTTLEKQVLWAGLEPGMKVADMGCGPGKSTFHLNSLVRPSGSVTGIDISRPRILYARDVYMAEGITYHIRDLREPLSDLGTFDFVWVRFVLEFYRSSSPDIVRNLSGLLKPGGILCLADLDHNCLNHYGLTPELDSAIQGTMTALARKADFDAYAGRRLYSYLFDLDFRDIRVDISAHHLIYGDIGESDAFNWGKKLEVAARNSGYGFDEFDDGFDGFKKACSHFFNNPRRFTYTPIICCSGRKPG